MRYALALLLLGHGIAHLPGFLVGWQLASFPELPFSTTVLAHIVDVPNDSAERAVRKRVDCDRHSLAHVQAAEQRFWHVDAHEQLFFFQQHGRDGIGA